ATPAAAKKPDKPKPPLVRATDDIAEAGCRILEFHAARVRLHEPGTRSGDADALHDMRVATRRQRSLLRILKPWLRRKKAEHFRASLSETATALGHVRDLDVLIETANGYCEELKPGRPVAIAPLLAAWNAERTEARTALVTILDSEAWKEFDTAYAEFLAAPAGGHRAAHDDAGHERTPHLVAHVVPG